MQIPIGADMWRRLSNDRARVEWVLIEFPSTRGDDRLLHYWVCKIFYHIDIMKDRMSFEQFRSLPAQETLARRRREIQMANEALKPRERTRIKRERREAVYSEYYRPLMEWVG